MESTDRELVTLCLDGHPDAFEELVLRYQRRLLWLCYQMVHDWDEAMDLSQEAFARTYRSLHRFDLDRSFYTWMAKIAVNACIDFLRRRDVIRPIPDEVLAEHESPEDRPDVVSERNETERLVHVVLNRLPEKYRTVLLLKDIEGISGKEISVILDIDYQTVRWRIHQARKLFRAEWERRIDPGDDDY